MPCFLCLPRRPLQRVPTPETILRVMRRGKGGVLPPAEVPRNSHLPPDPYLVSLRIRLQRGSGQAKALVSVLRVLFSSAPCTILPGPCPPVHCPLVLITVDAAPLEPDLVLTQSCSWQEGS